MRVSGRVAYQHHFRRNEMHLIVTAAYGRTYASAKAIKADLTLGKDFMILNIEDHGRYVNIMELGKVDSVEFRYGKRGEKVTCLYAKELAKIKAAYDTRVADAVLKAAIADAIIDQFV